MLRIFCALLALTLTSNAVSHGPARSGPTPERHIHFPDTADYQTLVLDLHTHSVFSDGHVWPTIRVSEALRDGLDGLAITEHLEFQPHISDIPHPDRNRAYQEALRAAQGHPLKVIPGVEITRTDEPGHINAVFVKDANPLVKKRQADQPLPSAEYATREEAVAFTVERGPLFNGAHAIERDGKTIWRPYPDAETYLAVMNFGLAVTFDPREVLQAANDQGAFVFWNHPSFATVDAELNDFHRAAIRDRLLHGVEIANGDYYYPNAHRLAMKHDLALIGVSDVHELIDWDYQPEAQHNPGHRPVTLVLAEDDSLAAMRDALFARRTVVWWKDKLIGRPAEVDALLAASLTIEAVESSTWGIVVRVRNASDAPFQLRHLGDDKITSQASTLTLVPNGVTDISMKVNDKQAPIELTFEVLNALIAPGEAAQITLSHGG